MEAEQSGCQPNGAQPSAAAQHRPGSYALALAEGRVKFQGPCGLADLDGVNLDLSGCDLSQGCFLVNPGSAKRRCGTAGRGGPNFAPGADLGRRPLFAFKQRAPAGMGRIFPALPACSRLISSDGHDCIAAAWRVAWSPAGWLLAKAGLVEADFSAALDQLPISAAPIFQGATSVMPYSRAAQACCSSAAWSRLYGARISGRPPGAGGPAGCDLRDASSAVSSETRHPTRRACFQRAWDQGGTPTQEASPFFPADEPALDGPLKPRQQATA